MTDPISILYVDDEQTLLEVGKVFLERQGGFEVTIIPGAPEAIETLRSTSFDVIVSDYQMPYMDGIEFLKHLKAEGNPTPFILFTGRGREEVVIEALNNGADFYLQKGGEPKAQFAELANKIRHTVSRRRAEVELRKTVDDLTKKEELLRKQSETLLILSEIISIANRAENLPELYQSILKESLRLLNFDAGGIYSINRDTRTANLVYSENLPPEFLEQVASVLIDEPPHDTLFIHHESIFTDKYAELAPEHLKISGFQSLAGVPLLSKGVVIGALNLTSQKRQINTEEERQTLIALEGNLAPPLSG